MFATPAHQVMHLLEQAKHTTFSDKDDTDTIDRYEFPCGAVFLSSQDCSPSFGIGVHLDWLDEMIEFDQATNQDAYDEDGHFDEFATDLPPVEFRSVSDDPQIRLYGLPKPKNPYRRSDRRLQRGISEEIVR